MGAQGAPKPAGPTDRISDARLDADGLVIIGSDGHPQYPPTVGDNMAIVVGGTDKDRMTKIYSGLSEGGTLKGPLTAQPSGVTVGWLTERFGINWMVSIDKA